MVRNVPKLRFKEFSGEWESNRIGDITKLTDGMHFTPTYVESGIPFWSIETVVSNVSPKYITNEEHENAIKRCKPQKNDILLTRIGTLAKVKLIDWNDEFSIYVSLALIKSSTSFNSMFAKFYFETEYYKKDFLSKSLLTAVPSKINMEDLRQTIIKLPSLQEQEKIASFLSLIDDKINLQSERVKYLKDYKKGLMQKIFSRKLRFKDENGNDYPEWEEKKLGEIFIFQYGQFNNNPDNGANGIIGGYHKYNAENSIIIGHMGIYAGTVLWERRKHFVTYNGTITKPKNIEKLIPKFGYYLLLNKNIQKVCTGSGQPFLSYNDLNNVKVFCSMSIIEQNKISNLLSSLDKKIEKEQEKLNLLNEYKKGLLQQMFV